MLLLWVLNRSILRVPAVAIPSTTAQSVAANVWMSMMGPRRIPGSRLRSGQPLGSLHGTCGVQIGGVFLAKAAFGGSQTDRTDDRGEIEMHEPSLGAEHSAGRGG